MNTQTKKIEAPGIIYMEALKARRDQQRRRESLSFFTRKVFETVSPKDVYLHNWHIDEICAHLEAVYAQDITRLIINIPPRYMKSIACSVAFPAWCLGDNPSFRFMASSYSQTLAFKHSTDCRDVVESEWYKAQYPKTRLSMAQASKQKFETTEKGYRVATSVMGGSIGEGGDILLCDDPHNPKQALSDVQREGAITWFDTSFYTRLNDKIKGAIVVIMQRLHEGDVSGHLLEQMDEDNMKEWTHLCIPAEAPEHKVYSYTGKEVQAGDVLWPEREDAKTLRCTKRSMGSRAYAGQYDQNPHPAGGDIVELEWFKTWYVMPKVNMRIIQVWDTAYKTKEHNDYSACITALECEKGFLLLDFYMKRLKFPGLKRMMRRKYDEFKARGLTPHVVLVEDKASGQSAIQELEGTKLPIIAWPCENDKTVRLQTVSPIIESGNVFLPEAHPLMQTFLDQLEGFPNATFDDLVDCLTMLLLYLRTGAGWDNSSDDFTEGELLTTGHGADEDYEDF